MKALFATGACLLLLAGCGGAAQQPASTVTVTTTATETVTATAEPEVEPTVDATGSAIGEKVDISGAVSFTVLEHATSEFAGEPNQGYLVEACAGEAGPVSTAPWMAVGESGGRYQASGIVGDPVYTPTYPAAYDEAAGMLDVGECLQGWMTFSTGERLVELRYSSDVGKATWSLS